MNKINKRLKRVKESIGLLGIFIGQANFGKILPGWEQDLLPGKTLNLQFIGSKTKRVVG